MLVLAMRSAPWEERVPLKRRGRIAVAEACCSA